MNKEAHQNKWMFTYTTKSKLNSSNIYHIYSTGIAAPAISKKDSQL